MKLSKMRMFLQLTTTKGAIPETVTEAINKISGADVDTHLLKEDTGDIKTPLTATRIKATEVHHQLPKARVHTEETMATKIKAKSRQQRRPK